MLAQDDVSKKYLRQSNSANATFLEVLQLCNIKGISHHSRAGVWLDITSFVTLRSYKRYVAESPTFLAQK